MPGRAAWNFLSLGPRTDGAAPARMHELDGIRGWAALNVVLFHIFLESFSTVMPGFHNFGTDMLFNGGLDVAVFFVLSGEALSAAYFAGKGEIAVVRLALKRYFRLTIPILATCLIIFLLFRACLVPGGYAILHREDWAQTGAIGQLSPSYFLTYALFGVYGYGAQAVDPLLWTMHYEMIGSLLVFGVLLFFRHIKYIWVLLALAMIVLLTQRDLAELGCFIAGLFFCAARQNGIFHAIQSWRWSAWLSWPALLFTMALAILIKPPTFFLALFAIPLVFFIFCNKPLCDFFASRPLQILGKISFPLYLVQFPILISFTSGAVVYATAHGGLGPQNVWLIAILSLALCLGAAFLFLPVEWLTKWTGNQVTRLLLR